MTGEASSTSGLLIIIVLWVCFCWGANKKDD